MIYSKKYFLAILTAIGIQAVFGINLAKAYCEAEVLEICKHDGDVHSKAECDMKWQTDTDDRVERTLKQPVKEIEQDIEYQKSELNRYLKGNNKHRDFHVSQFKAALCSSNVALAKLTNKQSTSNATSTNNSTPNQSSSGSSSQSNKKTNRQSDNNQSSSNLSEQTIKKINEAVDQTNFAHDNKDYAKSIAALNIILAHSKNMTVLATATNRLAGYYNNGYGVPKDELKAQALFEQASNAGDADADTHICENYENGTGGVIKNHQTAIKYCTAAAAKGQVSAMGKLGYLYHAGEGTYNPQLGNEWLCKAAKKGERTAIRNAEKLNLSCN